jgi:hypothetical protein
MTSPPAALGIRTIASTPIGIVRAKDHDVVLGGDGTTLELLHALPTAMSAQNLCACPHESCALHNKQKLHIFCRVNVAFSPPQVCRWGRDKLGPSCSY